MSDIQQEIDYWRDGASEDLEVAGQLVELSKVRHGLFFAHLSLEKLLKSHICCKTQDHPPRIHNLVRLVEIIGLELSEKHLDILAEMNEFNLEGRYPLPHLPIPTIKQAQDYMQRTREVYQWLSQQL